MNDPRQSRRQALMETVGDSVALVRGASSQGVNPNFFYLTGLQEPRGALLLAPNGVRIGVGRENPGPDYVRGRMARQVLFLPRPDPLAARWGEDAAATVGSVDAAGIGVDAVLGTEQIETVLGRALPLVPTFHYVRATPPALTSATNVDTSFTESVRRNFLGLEVCDLTPTVHEMRRLKDAGEVAAIERAVAVTDEAFRASMRLGRPGAREHRIEGEITRIYRGHGASHAFDPIVAAGPNAVLLHYGENSGPVESGQLMLVDSGAALDGYRADVSRTFPVDGRFNDRQREIYGIVLEALDAAISLCRPGALLADIHAEAYRVIDAAGYGESFIHGTSHHLGLETHDVGDVYRPLAPGAVITVEPGIYLREEGLGVRIEDDVVITKDGNRNLSAAIPRTVEQVEAAAARQ